MVELVAGDGGGNGDGGTRLWQVVTGRDDRGSR